MSSNVSVTISLDPSRVESGAKRVENALDGVAAKGQSSARQIAAATRQLPAQFTDIATQLAGGANPMLVLLQQGGQIKDSFGGIGEAVRGIGAAITPTAVAIGGMAAAAGTLAYLFYSANSQAKELRNTIQLTGNAAGLTVGRMDQLVQSVMQGSRQTAGEARSILIGLAATGRTSAGVLESQALAIARIADLSGRAGKEIAASFAGQLDGPAKFAAKLNETYNFLTLAEFKRIQQLEQQKRVVDAANLTNEALRKSLADQRGELSAQAVLLPNVSQLWSQFWQAAQNAARADSTLDKLAKVRGQLNAILASTGGEEPAAGTYSAGRIGALRQQLQALSELAKQENTEAARRSDDALKIRQQIDAAGSAKPGEPLGAIRSAREQYRADFLASERAFYVELQKSDEQLRDQLAKDPLGAVEASDERMLTQAQQRTDQQAGIMQGLVDANARAGAEMIEHERQRGLTLIELDRQIGIRRLLEAQFTGQALVDAAAEVNKRAELSIEALDQGLADKLKRAADATADRMTESISNGILEGFRRGSSFADIFVAELKAQFAKTILQPLIRPQIDAGNALIGSFFSGLANAMGFGAFRNLDFGGSMQGRAVGGPVAAGQTYLVGERGPEILRMGAQSGHITPNHRLGGLSVSMPVSVSIDARSDQAQVAQLVATAVAEGQRRMVEDLRARGVM